MRLSELGLRIGRLQAGPGNGVSDVAGVALIHLDIDADGLRSGLSAVQPHPPQIERRRLYVGRYALDGGDGLTGLGVAEDFGTFSSPIVLAPAPAVGRVYEGLIRHGIARDPGLGTETGWPPLVVGVDDTPVNPAALSYRHLGLEQVAELLTVSGNDAEGSVGMGRGLAAFGWRGGMGTASRRTEGFTVGVVVAANSGAPGGLVVEGMGLEPPGAPTPQGRGSVAVVATDAPLIPRQLDRLAARTGLGLARLGLFDATSETGLVLAFSSQPLGPPEGDDEPNEAIDMAGEGLLAELFQAAYEAVQEAGLNALLTATPGALPTLQAGAWVEQLAKRRK